MIKNRVGNRNTHAWRQILEPVGEHEFILLVKALLLLLRPEEADQRRVGQFADGTGQRAALAHSVHELVELAECRRADARAVVCAQPLERRARERAGREEARRQLRLRLRLPRLSARALPRRRRPGRQLARLVLRHCPRCRRARLDFGLLGLLQVLLFELKHPIRTNCKSRVVHSQQCRTS